MKIIHFLQNSSDFEVFVQYLKDIGTQIFSLSKQAISYDNVQFTNNCCSTYFLNSNIQKEFIVDRAKYTENDFNIKLSTPYQIDSYWQLGRICLYNEQQVSATDLKIFQKLVKYIKVNYRLSEDKKFYIGRGIYKDWLEYKVNFLTLFFYKTIKTNPQTFDFEVFKKDIEKKGYIVRTDGVDIRRTNNEDSITDIDGYVIFSKECCVTTRLVARKEYYSNNSQCVFAVKNRRNEISFIIDNRLFLYDCKSILKLYEYIQLYLSSPEKIDF